MNKNPSQPQTSNTTSKHPIPKDEPNVRLTVISGELKWNIEEGGGKMDPYVKVKYVKEDFQEIFEVQTKVAMDEGQSPQWDQTFEIYIEDLSKDLLFELWEWDKNSSDDYMGSGKINMQAALQYDGQPFQLEMIVKNKPFAILHIRVDQFRKTQPEEDELKMIMKDQKLLMLQQVVKFTKYLKDTGLERAFQQIFTEILTKKIERNDAYTYTALRLRQIGGDLKSFFINKNINNSILNNISEVQETVDNELQ